ncbi:MAG: ATP synthase subunit I [Paenibacillaceae bacterium]
MNNLSTLVKTVTRIFLLVLSISCLAWAVLPQYADMIGGLIVGVIAGMINVSHLSWRVHRMTGSITNSQLPKKAPIGFFFRACVALLAALIASKSLHLSLAALSAGLIVVPIVILAVAYFLNHRGNPA